LEKILYKKKEQVNFLSDEMSELEEENKISIPHIKKYSTQLWARLWVLFILIYLITI
jgi:hypothetical protein